jgi:hypothetical protein
MTTIPATFLRGDDSIKVGNQRVKRNVSGIPIGKARAPRVVANEHPSIG